MLPNRSSIAHRRLHDLRVAQAAGQDEELEVEREAALAQQGQHVGDHLAVHQLDPHLGVLHVQAEQQVDEALVAPRVQPPQRRVVHRGVRVPLAPDDDVGLLGPHDGDEGGQELRRDVAVGVDEAEIPAPAHPEPGPERVALADVAVERDPPHDALGEAVEREGAAVGRAVRHGDDLEGHARRVEHPHHVRDGRAQAVAGVVVGDDDGDVERGVGQHGDVGGCGLRPSRSGPAWHLDGRGYPRSCPLRHTCGGTGPGRRGIGGAGPEAVDQGLRRRPGRRGAAWRAEGGRPRPRVSGAGW